ncbi:MAG TPA: TIGR03621 family F420-dependent LLM class oxidoreductase [Pseudomonadales bacterium]|nr:TIGR03621 family F420-dependent LLM class oxidoreductase [Pseudomonadales bacterium]
MTRAPKPKRAAAASKPARATKSSKADATAPKTKAFRFAVQSFNAPNASAWTETARKAESLGYSTLHLADHLLGPGPALAKTNHPVQNLAAVPAMAHAAAVTTTLKIGCRVFCIDYRLPVVLVKEAMTLDLLSDGRLELGLGAGWLEEEYRATGIEFDPPGERISRLEDVVAALRTYAADGNANVSNNSVKWRDFEGVPKPVSRPLPPLMIGGGSPRILKIAGREADIVSLNFNNREGVIGPDGVRTSSADETARKIDWIRSGAGKRFDEIEIEIGAYFTFVTEKPDDTVAMFAKTFGLTQAEMSKHPHALFGSVDTIVDELQRRRETFGISYVTVPDSVMTDFAPVVARLAGT